MEDKIKIGIVGYGNLGRGVESAIGQNSDMELVSVFTRREPDSVSLLNSAIPVRPLATIEEYKEEIDVLILCGGSKNDLPEQGPVLSASFNTVDSFDTHAKIPEYFESVNASAKPNGKTAIISVGWDPGLFSINRLFGEAILPEGATYTFWGKGLSQGHSDAVRRIEGVKGAVQYTIPVEEAVDRVRSGVQPELSTREKHTRECFVVLQEGADAERVERDIVTMPDYFADYDTTVHFISEEGLAKDHAAMPHGGFVIRSGKTGEASNQVMEFSLTLDSNPEFTSSVLVAYARAAYKMNRAGDSGAKTVYDVAPGLLSPKSPAELRKELL
ncbi:meso-diaminopimelate D-dehydrogenase [Sporosarcina sp. NCCP-2222]|uniref:diaminopimelate dehydrogenase n=1 Tax=Sporosarcina sp. NCCP-2222 TaxID=2935073 RepID=UPI00207FE9F6|nr:diaminopimelate dehydrogenase [Sporosarcina sp. NCCP-2222]GKV54528.1 meso-diaminopimelate D-dehydrogenase [Sporosarcina sp. NCCP-2222]